MSRREMLRGRFLAGMLGAVADRAAAALQLDDGEVPRAREGDAAVPRAPMVMRYPRTSGEVASGSRSGGVGGTSAARFRRSIPVLRPPGAIDEAGFLAGCTRCEACITACPHEAIVQAPPRFREAAGTPMIDPDSQPCRMCADYPCIEACEPDVLSHLVPKVMGTARIVEQTCIAHQGTTCTVCSEHCPVEGAFVLNAGRPRIDESVCTGCGVCRHVCPSPENAILLMPMFARPPRPAPPEASGA